MGLECVHDADRCHVQVVDITLASIENVSPVGYEAQELVKKLDQGVDMYFSGTFETPFDALVWAQERVR